MDAKSNSATLEPISSATATSKSSNILCYCNNVTADEFVQAAQASPHDGFDALLERTKVGNRCTACLLDAEYLFVQAATRSSAQVRVKTIEQERIPLRRRFWRWVDQFLPLSPYPLFDHSPVLRGPNLDTSICVANDQFMYRDGIAAPPLELAWSVFDASGKLCKSGGEVVHPNQAITIPVSSWLPQEQNETGLSVGSVRMTRRFLEPGVRGTTRPQILLEALKGCCAVHVQAPNGVGNYEFNLLSRSDTERVFLTFLNADNRPVAFRGFVDVLDGAALRPQWDSGEVIVPKRQVRLFEINTGNLRDEIGLPQQAFLRWTADGIHKAHVFCASVALDQFSVDHP